jgi:Na+/melibiose symporter-like transporter
LIPLSAFRKVQGYESPSTQAFEFFTMPLVWPQLLLRSNEQWLIRCTITLVSWSIHLPFASLLFFFFFLVDRMKWQQDIGSLAPGLEGRRLGLGIQTKHF